MNAKEKLLDTLATFQRNQCAKLVNIHIEIIDVVEAVEKAGLMLPRLYAYDTGDVSLEWYKRNPCIQLHLRLIDNDGQTSYNICGDEIEEAFGYASIRTRANALEEGGEVYDDCLYLDELLDLVKTHFGSAK